jgi:MoaA/NifB/PqqE/SkfB family radical SAM enzyme
MLSFDKITWLHVEPTTNCNAHCPACGRNNNGYGIKSWLKLESLLPAKFLEVINQLPNLKTVQLCGTLGDPIASKYIDDLISICIEKNFEIQIHTNGSLKTPLWWSELAKKLNSIKHTVTFGIDGLEGIHEIHRQGTSFNKVIENAKAFINAGGIADWQFLLFKHNKHQIKDCMRLSQQLGFKKFKTIKSIRIPSPAKNYITGEDYRIEADDTYHNFLNDSILKLTVEDCMHLSYPSIYLNANGLLSPCCYLNNVDYQGNMIDEEINQNKPNDRCKNTCGRTVVAHKN